MIRDEPRRRSSNRVGRFDYRSSGLYFVTTCTLNREILFGEVIDGTMQLNNLGQIIHDEWVRTAAIRSNVQIDAFVVMPNHVHGILWIERNNSPVVDRATRRVAPTNNLSGERARGPKAKSLGAIIGQIKSASSKRINVQRGTPGVPIWQRGFHDRVIRNDAELERIRTYIDDNPMNWHLDQENPAVLCRGDALRRPV